MIFRDPENEEGIQMGGQNCNDLRYVDETALIAASRSKLQTLLTLHKHREKWIGN